MLLFLGSGCFSDPKPAPTTTPTSTAVPENPAYAKVRELLAGVACTSSTASLTQTSSNLKVIGTKLGTDGSPPGRGTYGELALRGNLSLQAIYNARGFVRFNVTNPAEPETKGPPYIYIAPIVLTAPPPASNTFDVKLSTDGLTALVGLSDRILAVDLRPTTPFARSFVTFPPEYRGQAHMIAVQPVGLIDYVWAVPSLSGAGVLLSKLTIQAGQPKIEVVRVYQTPTPTPTAPQPLMPHDVYITTEVENGENHSYMYMANGFGGIVVWNIDDPTNVVTVASVPAGVGAQAQSTTPTYYHSIQMKRIDGQRIVATTAEAGYNTVKVWNFTDFKAPKLMAQWTYDSQAPYRSEHNLQIVNGTLFVAHYTEGLFGFDLHSLLADEKAGLRPILHYQPPPGGATWDVILQDGLIYLSDVTQGLAVLGYGCFGVGDPDLSSDS